MTLRTRLLYAAAALALLGATAGPALATSATDLPTTTTTPKKHTHHKQTASHKAKPKAAPVSAPAAAPAASPAPVTPVAPAS